MTLRLITAARKSRSGDAGENERYARQDTRAGQRAERDGHAVVATVHDTVSSQTAPWDRPELKSWMTDPARLAMYDGILVSDTDRLSRTDDRGWHDIESWCYETGKVLLTADGVQFPARDDSDRYQWIGLKRRARTYWEDVRDKHADARKIVLANKAATGRPPFGYRVAGAKYGKRFEIDPVTGPAALKVFSKIIDGEPASAVAAWLGGQLGQVVRAQRVLQMVRNDSYLGERDGHAFVMLSPDMPEMIATARAALESRSFDRGGNRVTHAYSSRIFCQCGANLNHHQSTRNGQPSGQAKYRCSRGRRGIAGEARCQYGAWLYADVNAAVETAVGSLSDLDGILVTTGGDAQRQAKLDALAKDIERAVRSREYARAGELQAAYALAEAEPVTVETKMVLTGKTTGQRFTDSDLDARRAMLVSGQFRVFACAELDPAFVTSSSAAFNGGVVAVENTEGDSEMMRVDADGNEHPLTA